ncbi:TetR-like C-terminal domain-containing protein [Paenibacillus sp. FSL R7-0345]|uniref:TetR-like C-terminal domain-containing protein n=1 Tax=Paenibacillus sp. FSL R7-0345 TaxID=2954535 RepID=UPI00315A1C7B
MLEQFNSIIKKLGTVREASGPFIDPPSGYVRPFEYVLEQKHFFKRLLGFGGDTNLSLQMTELINQQLINAYLINHQQITSADIPVKHQYLFAYLSSAYVGTMQFWIQRDFDLSPAEMAILFSQISRLGSAHITIPV